MSWIDSVREDFTIITGDKKRYTINWLNANRSLPFNIAVFNFKGVKKSLVDRREVQSLVYDLEVYFQGGDNLIRCNDFIDSATRSKLPWTIFHPMYGNLLVQPVSDLKLDDAKLNATKVSITVMETIGSPQILNPNISPIDVIQVKKLTTDIALANTYAVDVPQPLISDINAMKDNTLFLERAQLAFSRISDDAQLVKNTYNQANAAIDGAFSDAFGAVRSIQNLINLPAIFENTILNRVNFLLNASLNLYDDVTSLHTPKLKKLYENNVGTIITTLCSASVTNPSPLDYSNRTNVISIINAVTTGYNAYIRNLDTLQTDNGGNLDSYIPDANSLTLLGNLVNFTVSNLFDIAANSKQQRTYRLPTDSNIIVLAWKLYGLLPDDSTIDQLMTDNNIGRFEIMQIRKGRDIVYYV